MTFQELEVGQDFTCSSFLLLNHVKFLRLMKVSDCEDKSFPLKNLRNSVELNGVSPGRLVYVYPESEIVLLEKNIKGERCE